MMSGLGCITSLIFIIIMSLTALYKLFYFFTEMFYDRGNHHDFLSLVRQLSPPGELTQFTKFPFEFLNVDKPYETYTGTNVRLRLVQCTCIYTLVPLTIYNVYTCIIRLGIYHHAVTRAGQYIGS